MTLISWLHLVNLVKRCKDHLNKMARVRTKMKMRTAQSKKRDSDNNKLNTSKKWSVSRDNTRKI